MGKKAFLYWGWEEGGIAPIREEDAEAGDELSETRWSGGEGGGGGEGGVARSSFQGCQLGYLVSKYGYDSQHSRGQWKFVHKKSLIEHFFSSKGLWLFWNLGLFMAALAPASPSSFFELIGVWAEVWMLPPPFSPPSLLTTDWVLE